MTLPKSLTTVTTFSKLLALWLYIFLPFVGFYLGMQYQQIRSITKESTSVPAQVYTSEPLLPMETKDDELTIEESQKNQVLPETNWKTYTNDFVGYQVSFPSNYTKLVDSDSKEPWRFQSPKGEINLEMGTNYVSGETSIDANLQEILSNKELANKYSQIIKTTVNNIPTIHMKPKIASEHETYTLFYTRTNKVFLIVKYPQITSRQKEFEQILSTFKFLDQK